MLRDVTIFGTGQVMETPRALRLEGSAVGETNDNSAPNALPITDFLALSENQFHLTSIPKIDVRWENLSANELAEARVDAVGPDGLPTAGTILLSTNAAGIGWYIDPTPLDHSEFTTTLAPNAFLASGDSAAAGKYDLLTVLLHEEGHLLGFNADIPGFAAHVGTVAGSQVFIGPNFTAKLTPDDDHLDSGAYANDLMSASLAPGVRRLPSELDVEVIDAARNISPTALAAYEATASTTSLPPRVHTSALMAATLPPNWTTHGTVNINGNTLSLQENSQILSGVSQTFTVPDGATSLQFTISADHLLANSSGNPPDAFEAALLDVNGQPVNGAATGLSNTDAFLNIQSSGQIFYGPGVTVSGRSASGQTGSLASSFTVTEDLTGIAPGTQLTLYFDLLGFGAATSSVSISTGANNAPVASPVSDTVQEHGPAKTVSGSYTDADTNDTHAFAVDTTTDATKGSVTNNNDGTFTYDPNGAFISLADGATGTDKFLYTVTDSAGASSTATVTMTITGENDAPVAADVAAGTRKDSPPITISAAVLDPDIGDTHTFSIDTSTDGTKGRVINNQNGTFTYDPNGAFNDVTTTATDKFRYTVTDGADASSTATVTITITGQNDLPVAVADSYATNEDTALTVAAAGVLGNDSDVDGDTLNAILVTGPATAR